MVFQALMEWEVFFFTFGSDFMPAQFWSVKIMYSNWLKVDIRIGTSNQIALFQCSRTVLKVANEIGSWIDI